MIAGQSFNRMILGSRGKMPRFRPADMLTRAEIDRFRDESAPLYHVPSGLKFQYPEHSYKEDEYTSKQWNPE